ncbi:MAG TPA: BLUF domain-containing protein [Methylophaga aminisulfidivorans]|uniref:BLUF domain-containing protein n=2 Tax=root TaxID=1 RepID=A0A7C1ZSE6_9GAMM|nr:BLUF domain-containing protein [Methylophaga aminisulfidivorans]HEC74967.1 BLUF domain-containing protein [Methylophaga aminisulfidivorans]
MTTLRQIIYKSQSTIDYSHQDIETMMAHFRQKNAHFSVTGCLIYFDKTIIQCLEGSKSSIEYIYASICNDIRHQNVELISNQAIEERDFSDWEMAVRYIPKENQTDSKRMLEVIGLYKKEKQLPIETMESRHYFQQFMRSMFGRA